MAGPIWTRKPLLEGFSGGPKSRGNYYRRKARKTSEDGQKASEYSRNATRNFCEDFILSPKRKVKCLMLSINFSLHSHLREIQSPHHTQHAPSMSASTSASSQLLQDLVGDFYSRRLLLHSPLYQSQATAAPPATGDGHDSSETYTGSNSFDTNVVMVLSVLLCALICSLGLNSIIRCALRCSSLVASSGNSPSARLANTGVKKKALKTFPTLNYSAGVNLPGLDTECVICLSEFTPGERIRILPKCNHGFHLRCIDKWLNSHSSCPTCRHSLAETCQKIVGCSQASSSEAPPASQESTINIAPLQPESFVCNYREIS